MRPFGQLPLRVCKSKPDCFARRLARVSRRHAVRPERPRGWSSQKHSALSAAPKRWRRSRARRRWSRSLAPRRRVLLRGREPRSRRCSRRPTPRSRWQPSPFRRRIELRPVARVDQVRPSIPSRCPSHGQAELRHDEIVLHAHRAYWLVNCGLRFSKNAEQPSWASRLSRTRLIMVCSKGRAALSGMSPP